jgi:hypothetical protein
MLETGKVGLWVITLSIWVLATLQSVREENGGNRTG